MPSTRARGLASLLPYLVIAIVGAIAAYLQLFSNFLPFDDEGYYLISVQSFLDGGHLYSQVYSQYGPLYYELFGAFYKLTGIEVTTDAGRFIVLVLWVGTALIYAWITELLTSSRVLGILACLAAFSILRFHHDEPLAPVGLLAAMTALSFVPLAAGDRVSPRLVAASLGAAASAFLLIKINVGVLYLVAVIAAALMLLPAKRHRNACFAIAVALLILMPVALTWTNKDLAWVRELVAIELLAVVAIAVTIWPRGLAPSINLRRWLATLAVAALAVAVPVCALIVILGTGPRVLLDGVVLDPSRHPKLILIAPDLHGHLVPLGVLSLAAALVTPLARARLNGDALTIARIAVRLLVAVVVVIGATQQLDVGPLGAALGLPVLLAWVAVRVPQELEESNQLTFSRLCLVLLAVVLVLGAYPIAASREMIAALPFVLVGSLIASDAVRLARVSELPGWASPNVVRATGVGLALLVGLQLTYHGVVAIGREGHRGYHDGIALNVHGAERMRLSPRQAGALAKMTHAVAGCDPLVMMPGYPSFYLWSRIKPPTGQNVPRWVQIFQSGRQQEVVDAIKDKPHLCVIRNEQAVADNFSDGRVNRTAANARPLRRYLLTTSLRKKLVVDTGVYPGRLTLYVRPGEAQPLVSRSDG